MIVFEIVTSGSDNLHLCASLLGLTRYHEIHDEHWAYLHAINLRINLVDISLVKKGPLTAVTQSMLLLIVIIFG
jgi:hypothetical protein